MLLLQRKRREEKVLFEPVYCFQAINHATTFGDKTLSIDWYDPFAKATVAPVIALSRHDVDLGDDNDEDGDDKGDAEADKSETDKHDSDKVVVNGDDGDNKRQGAANEPSATQEQQQQPSGEATTAN
eukprot:TRINITY_DN12469_c0_g1_i2.p10 TRINITY_DN12469_c0_g1~~TRINITY_DN12469_c0_g1_i2.p10  ORF type:complete len:127 (+),score=38.50 TRINITY_DN12469_c0_g1_i2:5034-5414(+)